MASGISYRQAKLTEQWDGTDLSSYRTTPPCDVSKLRSYIKAADRTHCGEFTHSPNTSGPIQNT